MNELYPLKFTPIFKDKIWGGHKIKDILGMDFSPLPNCGEVWVLSGVEENTSIVSNGFLKGNELNELIEVYMGDLTGDAVYEKFGNEFPILIKFIDANDYLSVQVHPDDELAAKRKIGYGKSEMWYILQADENAELITGFNQKLNKDSLKSHPEVTLRINNLKKIFPELKVEVADEKASESYAVLEKIAGTEALPNFYHSEDYGVGIYTSLQFLQDGEEEKYYKSWLGKCFSKIYEARKNYKLNRYLDRVDPKNQSESYQQFLNFMWNLSLDEIKNIADYYQTKES